MKVEWRLTRTTTQRWGVLAALMLTLLVPTSPAAAAEPDVVASDAKRDAHPPLDITRVQVSHTPQAVKVVVKVRDYAAVDSNAPVATVLGVYFDTKRDRVPEHLIKIDGMHTAAGSTRDWNELRPNGFDPWGDWTDCFPEDWDRPLIKTRPSKDQVVFTAPRSCLGEPESLRIAVQSYKPYGSTAKPDWAIGTRKYLARIDLS